MRRYMRLMVLLTAAALLVGGWFACPPAFEAAWTPAGHGEVTLVGRAEGWSAARIIDLLEVESATPPQGRCYRFTPLQEIGPAMEALVRHQRFQSNPGAPPPPPGDGAWLLLDHADTDDVRAATYKCLSWSKCVLSVDGGGGTLHRALSQAEAGRATILSMTDTGAMLIFVDTYAMRSGDQDLLLRVEPPAWEPQVLIDGAKQGLGYLRVVGQSADGKTVWFKARVLSGPPRAIRVSQELSRFDARSHQLTTTGSLGDLQVLTVLPSADNALLAVVEPWKPRDEKRLRRPLHVIDAKTGSIHEVAWPPWPGDRRISPVGWSRTSPRRLFFVDERARLWRLDITEPLP